jgi:hypothetical protein
MREQPGEKISPADPKRSQIGTALTAFASIGTLILGHLAPLVGRLKMPASAQENDPGWKGCNCVRYLYLLRDGKDKTISVKTWFWEKGEEWAQGIRDSWDPVEDKLRELQRRGGVV